MKKYTILAFAGLLMTSCLDDAFLDREPLDELTEQSIFIDYNGFKTYNLSLYEGLPGYSAGLNILYGPDFDADNFFKTTSGSESDWVWHKLKVPTSGGGWDYSYIRKVNIMLDNIDKPNKLTEQEKLHLKSVGYFFRSYKYMNLLSKFGDIIWVEHVLNEKSEELYKPRDSRDVVANNILENLKFAEENINEEGDGPNTINKDVVRALISRFCLFEGTWRKYHGLNDSKKFLQECVRVSKILTEKHPILHANYDELFNSLSLKGIEGILLYREYEKNIVTHNITGAHKAEQLGYEMTKDAVDSYLCTDGTPIYNQPDFPAKEQDPYTEFANRDVRLLYSVMPPYRVATGPAAFERKWWYTENPKDRIFISVMDKLSNPGFKVLPSMQNGGNVCKFSPHFHKHNGGFAFQATQGGYFPFKFYNDHEPYPAKTFTSDAPIFRMGEVLLNYAEAAYELGEINQEIIDLTINKLRDRGEVAHLSIDNIITDERRDSSVTPLLWEIRRERRVELMGEGFRFDDIRRWKKGEYANKHKLGRWYSAKQLVADGVIASEANCKINFINNGKLNKSAGYIVWEKDPVAEGYGWLDHYYLYPLPLNDMALNPQLVQNPGWEK